MTRLQPVIGLVVMIGGLYLLSSDRKAVRWRVVAWGLGLQFLLALFVLRTTAGQQLFGSINRGFICVMNASSHGAEFVFGSLGVGDEVPVVSAEAKASGRRDPKLTARIGFIFAFRALPPIIFFSSLMAIGYHLGVMQAVVRAFAKVMSWSMGTSGAETMSAAANIFVGQTEAPLMVRPYVNGMTSSELMAVMVGGFANTAGGVMIMYITLLADRVPDIGAHLLTSSILTGPASLMMAKLSLPETQESQTAGRVRVELPRTDVNVVDAAARGATEGLTLALNVAAMLIVFIAMVSLVDAGLGAAGRLVRADEPWTMAGLFGKLLWPLAWLMGVPRQDCTAVGQLLGLKTFLNELVAYMHLSGEGGKGLTDRGYLIASYALCGFANIGSIGIQIGGIGAMAPERRGELARLGLRAMIIGSLVTFSAACVVAIIL